ncbi:MAG: hypothetical protein ACLFRD_12320, partial [Nitriliruptoraceae bacterium]
PEPRDAAAPQPTGEAEVGPPEGQGPAPVDAPDASEPAEQAASVEPDVVEPDVVEPDVIEVEETPAATAAEETAPATAPAGAPAADDELATVQARWAGVLELLKQRSRRYHAIFLPAEPQEVRRGVLVLRYGPRYVAFHAVQARTHELSDALSDALEQACGLRLRIEVTTDDQPAERRPVPPSVTPDDARTPVLDDPRPSAWDDGAAGEEASHLDDHEGAEVREAEHAGGHVTDDEVDVDQLLRTELGARLVDERPPPGQA